MLEFGCNLGVNLHALENILPKTELNAIEINAKAAKLASENTKANVINCSAFEYEVKEQFDLVYTTGVMIHINPDLLDELYQKMYNASKKYILVAEYYNSTPIEVEYRGNTGKLFKRDFAGEMLDKFSDLKLVDYGFIYHRDNIFPTHDTTWFLLEKK